MYAKMDLKLYEFHTHQVHPYKKFLEDFQLITKVFLGTDSNRVTKYTFKKILGSRLAILNLSQDVCFEINLSAPLEKIH